MNTSRKPIKSCRNTLLNRSTNITVTLLSLRMSDNTRCGRRSTSNSRNPDSGLNSGGLGTMGFSLPAAIGAQLGCPEKTVVNINGDGSYIMTIQELVPAVTMKLPLKIFIINNMYLGMVRQWQELFHGKRYSAVDYHDNPDFALLAQAFGATGLRVEHTRRCRTCTAEGKRDYRRSCRHRLHR